MTKDNVNSAVKSFVDNYINGNFIDYNNEYLIIKASILGQNITLRIYKEPKDTLLHLYISYDKTVCDVYANYMYNRWFVCSINIEHISMSIERIKLMIKSEILDILDTYKHIKLVENKTQQNLDNVDNFKIKI